LRYFVTIISLCNSGFFALRFISVEGVAQRAEKAIRIAETAEHNLKNISLSIPRDKLVITTGIFGSGKSSLKDRFSRLSLI